MLPHVLEAEHLSKTYRRRKVVRDISLHVHPGEIVGLLGPNGAGKTTSFNMIAGLVLPDTGSVKLGTQDLAHLPLYQRARLGLGYLPQETTVFKGLSVRDNLLSIYEILGVEKRQRLVSAQESLVQFNLTHVADNLAQDLSGGERRRLEMARALVSNPKVLLLDEPFAGVDPIATADIRRLVRRVCEQGIGILLTDHNVRETLKLCDRAYLIAEGKILLDGTPKEIVANPVARKTYLGEDFQL